LFLFRFFLVLALVFLRDAPLTSISAAALSNEACNEIQVQIQINRFSATGRFRKD